MKTTISYPKLNRGYATFKEVLLIVGFISAISITGLAGAVAVPVLAVIL